jgi:hypothetical protein
MKLELIELSDSEEAHGWAILPRHLIQHTIHNTLVRKVEELRNELEAAPVEKVPQLQAEIKAHRHLLGLIHRKDTLPTK